MPEQERQEIDLPESIFPLDVYRLPRVTERQSEDESALDSPKSMWKPWNRDGRPDGKKRYASFG